MTFTHLVFAAVLGIAAGGIAQAHAQAEAHAEVHADPVKFRVAMRSSLTSPNGKNLVDYKNAVELASGGTLAFEIHEKGTLLADSEVPQAISSGALEMAIIQVGLYAKDVPEVGIFQQPFLFDSNAIINAATRPESEIRKLIDAKILEKTGARVLWWQNYGPTIVMSKGVPLLDPDAMRQRNIRAFDTFSAEFVSLCGGRPHVIPYAKMLGALQAGTVDSVITGVFGVKEGELWRETQYISRLNHSAILLVIVVNDKLWQSLSPSNRDIMLSQAGRVEDEYRNSFANAETEAYRFSSEKGMTAQTITSGDLIGWRVCSSELVERFVEKLGDTAPRLMSAYGRLRAASCCNKDAGTASMPAR